MPTRRMEATLLRCGRPRAASLSMKAEAAPQMVTGWPTTGPTTVSSIELSGLQPSTPPAVEHLSFASTENQVPGCGLCSHRRISTRRSTRQDAQINYLSTLSIFMKQTTYLATLPNRPRKLGRIVPPGYYRPRDFPKPVHHESSRAHTSLRNNHMTRWWFQSGFNPRKQILCLTGNTRGRCNEQRKYRQSRDTST